MWLCAVVVILLCDLSLQSEIRTDQQDKKTSVLIAENNNDDYKQQIEQSFQIPIPESMSGVKFDEGRGFWDGNNYFIQSLSKLFGQQKRIKRKDDLLTPPTRITSGLKPELLPPELAFFDSNRVKTTSVPVRKFTSNNRTRPKKAATSPRPIYKPKFKRRRPIIPARYKRPIIDPTVKSQNVKSINLLDQSKDSKSRPYFVVQSQFSTNNKKPSAVTVGNNKQNNFFSSQKRKDDTNNRLTNKLSFISPAPSVNKNKIIKPKNTFLDNVANMATNVLHPLLGSPHRPGSRFHPRPPPQPQRIIIGPEEKSDKVSQIKDFRPSPQQGSVLADAFQPLFVASQSLDNGFPEDAMKPIHIPQRRLAPVLDEPSKPELVNFFG